VMERINPRFCSPTNLDKVPPSKPQALPGATREIAHISSPPTLMDGPPVLFALYGWLVASARLASHPMSLFGLSPLLSAWPMAYLRAEEKMGKY